MTEAGPRRTRFRRTLDAGAKPRGGVERRERGLAWIPLFQSIDPAAVEAALDGCDVLELDDGTALLREGQANRHIYVVLSGPLVVQIGSGPSQLSIPLLPGEMVGELSAIDGKPVSARVVAAGPVRVLEIPADVFRERLVVVPGVATNLMVALSERMRRTSARALEAQREQLELKHLKKELDVARQLQASMVPQQRPLFPGHPRLDACGLMEPASNVGGDFFDAFFVDDDRLFFCIGDVSGHGIAAALFMARCIGLLHLLAGGAAEPADVLRRLNDRLSVGNETDLFVTILCGYLDPATGRLRYSNGGHLPPLLASAQGRVEPLPLPPGTAPGPFPGCAYATLERVLEPGETLLLYTDGVTEAVDASAQDFTPGRCAEVLRRMAGAPLPSLLDEVREEVARFTGTRDLEDDCTLLALRRVDGEPGR